jgi:hypothetical protein
MRFGLDAGVGRDDPIPFRLKICDLSVSIRSDMKRCSAIEELRIMQQLIDSCIS